MARGFHGMKDDFMEIINHIVGLSCCSVRHVDNDDDPLLPVPLPTAGDFACLQVSQVISASNTEVRDVAATDDVTRSDFAYAAPVDDGAGLSFPQAEYFVTDQGLDPSFATVSNKLCPTFEREEKFWRGYHASLNIKLNKKDSESLPSLQIVEEKHARPELLGSKLSSSGSLNFMCSSNTLDEAQGTDKERCFESASDIEDYYCSSKREGEDVALQKHILVEDHIPSIPFSEGLQLRKRPHKNLDDEEIRDCDEVDGCDYVVL